MTMLWRKKTCRQTNSPALLQRARDLGLQQDALQSLESNGRLNHAGKQLNNLQQAYGPMLRQHFGLRLADAAPKCGLNFKDEFQDVLALQKTVSRS